jgi:hypothetical protein
MGIVSDIFGGGDTETKTVPWKPVADALTQPGGFFDKYDYFRDNYSDGTGIYTGSRYAGPAASELRAENKIRGQLAPLAGNLGAAGKALQGFLSPDIDSPQNQMMRDAFQANVQAGFDPIRMGVEDRFTMGQPGSIQQALAMGAATEPLSRALATGEADLINSTMDRSLQAINMAPSVFASRLLPAQIGAELGSRDTVRKQLKLEDMIQGIEAPRQANMQILQDLQGLLGPIMGTTGVKKAGGSPNYLQTAIGLGSAIGGMFTGNPFAVAGGLGALGGGSGATTTQGQTDTYNVPLSDSMFTIGSP